METKLFPSPGSGKSGWDYCVAIKPLDSSRNGGRLRMCEGDCDKDSIAMPVSMFSERWIRSCSRVFGSGKVVGIIA